MSSHDSEQKQRERRELSKAILEAARCGELDDEGPGGRGPIPVASGQPAAQAARGPGFWEWLGIAFLIIALIRCATG